MSEELVKCKIRKEYFGCVNFFDSCVNPKYSKVGDVFNYDLYHCKYQIAEIYHDQPWKPE